MLIVGGGPAGLEAARALGQRGYSVMLAEKGKELGGRVAREARLPGLAAWARVRDWRVGQLAAMPNVEIYKDSAMSSDDILRVGAPHVVIATGASWRRDGIGHAHHHAIKGAGLSHVHGPDDVMDGRVTQGPVLIFDDDHYYMAGVLAEKLARDGLKVIFVTPAAVVSEFTVLTLEQGFVQCRLLELGVEIRQQTSLVKVDIGGCRLACVYTGRETEVEAASVVLVTSRMPNEQIYIRLVKRPDIMEAAGLRTVALIGDCLSPQTIAAAVYDGHQYARELDTPRPANPDVPFRREHMTLGAAR